MTLRPAVAKTAGPLLPAMLFSLAFSSCYSFRELRFPNGPKVAVLAAMAIVLFCASASGMGRIPHKAEFPEALGTLLETRRIVPFGGKVSASTAELVAVAAARLKALGLASETLARRSKVRLSGTDPARLLTLASAVYPVSVSVTPAKDDPGMLVASARVYNAPRDPEAVVLDLLRDADSLQQQQAACIKYRTATDRALELLAAAAEARSNADAAREDAVAAELEELVARLRALETYMILLRREEIRNAPDKAAQALNKAVQQDKTNPLLWLSLGEALQRQEQSYAALDALNTAARLHAPPRVHYVRGLVQLRLHMPALAVDDFSKAVAAEPENAAWRHALGFARYLAGETQTMCADFYRACALGVCNGLEEVRKHGYCR